MQSLPRQEPVGLLIGAVVRRVKQASTRRARAFGLASRQLWVLVAVLETDGPSLRALSSRLRIDEPTASRVVAVLVRRGLVRVEIDPTDRRLTRLRPTPKALSLKARVLQVAQEIRAAVVAGFTKAEEAALREALVRVVANLDDLSAREAAGSSRRGRREARA